MSLKADKAVNTTHTATEIGWVCWRISATVGSATFRVDEVDMATAAGYYGKWSADNALMVLVDVGTTYWCNGASAFWFAPCKGVV